MTFLAAASDGGVAGQARVRLPRILVDLLGYGFASLAALACDYGTLLALVHVGVHYLLASTVGFCVGMVLAYALSVRFVFGTRRAPSRGREATGFVAVGIAGLVLMQVLLYLLVSRAGIAIALAKIPTTGLVFLFNFACRRGLVFARRESVGG